MSSEEQPKWIVVVTCGDPNSHLAHQTSFGFFESKEHAEDWSHNVYEDIPYVIDVLPFNDYKVMN
jgi:hypothetical protein|tara:strand:- start:467 stop:661 length:195 start_codon:yes stop_codon:yes gene_type:complete